MMDREARHAVDLGKIGRSLVRDVDARAVIEDRTTYANDDGRRVITVHAKDGEAGQLTEYPDPTAMSRWEFRPNGSRPYALVQPVVAVLTDLGVSIEAPVDDDLSDLPF